MAIKYKLDIISELKQHGFTSYKIRKRGLISEATLTKLRRSDTNIKLETVNTLCRLLGVQPGEILEYIPDPLEDQ